MRLYRKRAVVVAVIKQGHYRAPVYLVKTCRRVVKFSALDIEHAFDMNVIKSFTPVAHFFKIIAVSVNAVGSVVLDAELGQSVHNNSPRALVINKVCPVAVVDGNFNVLIPAVIYELRKVADCYVAVFVKAEIFGVIHSAVENVAADY